MDTFLTVLYLFLFGVWSVGVMVLGYRTGLDAGWRASQSLPPVDGSVEAQEETEETVPIGEG